MKCLYQATVLILTLTLTSTPILAANSASQTYKVSFTIPAHVTQPLDAKALSSKQQLVIKQSEMRAGQMVQVQSIVVP